MTIQEFWFFGALVWLVFGSGFLGFALNDREDQKLYMSVNLVLAFVWPGAVIAIFWVIVAAIPFLLARAAKQKFKKIVKT